MQTYIVIGSIEIHYILENSDRMNILLILELPCKV